MLSTVAEVYRSDGPKLESLLDYSSGKNFLSTFSAAEHRLKVEPVKVLRIEVLNKQKLHVHNSTSMLRTITDSKGTQHRERIDILVGDIKGYDIILGID